MAKGRIEQEIALKVTGLDDVKSIDDRIATLEKKKHKLSLDVDDGDASKKIGKIDDELAALDQAQARADDRRRHQSGVPGPFRTSSTRSTSSAVSRARSCCRRTPPRSSTRSAT